MTEGNLEGNELWGKNGGSKEKHTISRFLLLPLLPLVVSPLPSIGFGAHFTCAGRDDSCIGSSDGIRYPRHREKRRRKIPIGKARVEITIGLLPLIVDLI